MTRDDGTRDYGTRDDGTDDWVVLRIEEYLDGELPEDERAEMERRMAAEPAVTAEVEEARRFRRLAREAGALPIPEELGARIRGRVAEVRPASGGKIVLLRRLVTAAVAAAIIILIFNPIHIFEPEFAPERAPEPQLLPRPVARLGEPGTPAPLLRNDRLLLWLDQAKNQGPADAEQLTTEARELGLLAEVRSRLTAARGSDRAFLQAAEDLLVQVENGISPEALPMEAQMVAMARN